MLGGFRFLLAFPLLALTSCGSRSSTDSGLDDADASFPPNGGSLAGGGAAPSVAASGSGGAASSSGGSGGMGVTAGPTPGSCEPTLGFDVFAQTTTSHDTFGLISGDWNQDGKLDLAAVNGANSFVITVYLGLGDGTFSPGTDYAASEGQGIISAGDFDGDGNSDIAVAYDFFGVVSLYRGRGDGTFLPRTDTMPPAFPTSLKALTVGDWNQDGLDDVALNGERVRVLLSSGDGKLVQVADYPGGGAGLDRGDLNGDGKLDLAASEQGGQVQLLLGGGDGMFVLGNTYQPSDGVGSLLLTDLNGDGALDIAASGECAVGHQHGATLLGNGDGTFSNPVQSQDWLACDTLPPSAMDLNRDGKQDLFVGAVLLGQGDGALLAGPRTLAVGNLLGDFTGDGKLDLVVAFSPPGRLSSIQVAAGNGDGTFGVSSNLDWSLHPESLELADVDRDGKLDLIAPKGTAVEIAPGKGDGRSRLGRITRLRRKGSRSAI
jgi:hypothetical protein